ncbi:hypothetical protein ACFX2I_045859 [Malus domestica]
MFLQHLYWSWPSRTIGRNWLRSGRKNQMMPLPEEEELRKPGNKEDKNKGMWILPNKRMFSSFNFCHQRIIQHFGQAFVLAPKFEFFVAVCSLLGYFSFL